MAQGIASGLVRSGLLSTADAEAGWCRGTPPIAAPPEATTTWTAPHPPYTPAARPLTAQARDFACSGSVIYDCDYRFNCVASQYNCGVAGANDQFNCGTAQGSYFNCENAFVCQGGNGSDFNCHASVACPGTYACNSGASFTTC